MQKQNVIQLNQVREERFMQEKHQLVKKLEAFVDKKISFEEESRLQSYFYERCKYQITPNLKYSFFRFWLYFFHTFENGLRMIEWFEQENRSAESTMVKTWVQLQLKLVQAVEWNDDIVIYEDMLTKERYPVANNLEIISTPFPWYGTLGLLELFENKYYFNGVRVFVSPQCLNKVATKIHDLCKETSLTETVVMTNYFPELLGELFTDSLYLGDRKEKEIIQYKVQYQIFDEKKLISFLSKHFQVNQNEQQFDWIGEWFVYEDSEIANPIHIGKIYGIITLKNRKLIFDSLLEDKVSEFQTLLATNLAVKFVNIENKKTVVPFQIDVQNMVVAMDNNTPAYFSMYAQNSALLDVDAPIPMYDQLSIRKLIESGREHQADVWLKQSEYALYKSVYEEFGKVDVTADFNTVRKQLGLPLSQFVTGGASRFTSIKKEVRSLLQDEDIPFLEQLGITPSTVNNFYVDDLLQFFKEKVVGKSNTTVRKYRNSLYDLRYLLERSLVTSWEECTSTFWEHLLSIRYINLYEFMNITQLKDLFSTLKALAKWLNQCCKNKVGNNILKVVEQNEPDFISAAEALNNLIPYEFKALHYRALKRNFPKLKEKQTHHTGFFEVVRRSGGLIELKKLDDKQKQFSISLIDSERKILISGLILEAELALDETDQYHVINLFQVFPALAKKYLAKTIVATKK